LLLCDGRIAEAIECLARARELAPTEASRLQLVRAVTDGLWTDYATFRPLAESLALEEIDPGQRARILWAMGSGAQRAGDRTTALDTFLTIAEIDPVGDATEPLSAAVTVRRDRWLAARLEELLNDADPEDRALVADRLASLSKEAQVRYLPFQAATTDARTQLGADLARSENTLAAEQQLRAAIWFSQPHAAPEAVARLAEFLRLQGRPREASRLYKRLAGPLAGQICVDGQTGRQLVDALAAEHPARPDSALRPLWPPDTLEATTEKPDGQQATVSHVPVRVRAVDPQFDRPANIRVEQIGRSLFGYDDLGRQTWEIPLKQRTPNIGFRNGYYMAEGAQLGQILVVWLVTQVCAVDLSGETPRLLWDHETTELGGNDPRQQHRLQRANQRRMQMQRGGKTGGDSSPLVVAHGYVCFERNEELVAVDLLSGDVLWTRDDVPERIDLFGDARYVFVVPAEGTGEARVFSALDGHELGQRTLPARSDCLAAIGRRLLVWETNATQRRLRLIDAWTGESVWEREMPAETQVCLVRHEGVAALDPEGWFAVWQIESGEPLVETKLEVQPILEQIHVEQYGENLLIFTNRPPEPTAQRIFIHNAAPAVNVNGSLCCVGPQGRMLWSTEVMDQQLELDLPSELPVLLFSKRRQSQVPRPEGGVTTKVEYAILCLDKRSGRTLHDETLETHGHEIEIRAVDPKDGVIEVITRPLSIKIARVKDSP
jgi:outer membrane protein assembly factor BamB